ncbi:hypothetical protein SUDANB58_00627 [Streptomyces sp. enrichment culture]|uniref:hypothetical protein n=1 Tax=Streptomyces sp. enrichment culture TaxID=1795815 RepID=UPI003F56E5A9
MTDRTGPSGVLPRRPSRRRSAAVATALTILVLGLAGQLAGQPASAAEPHLGNPFAGVAFHTDPGHAERADAFPEAAFGGGPAAGKDTGDLRLRPAKDDGPVFDGADDHSRGTGAAYADTPAVPAPTGTRVARGTPPG